MAEYNAILCACVQGGWQHLSDLIMLLWWRLSLSCSGTNQNANPLSSEAAAAAAYSDQYSYNYGLQTHGENSDGTWRLEWQAVNTAVCCVAQSIRTYFILSLSNSSMLAWWWRCGDGLQILFIGRWMERRLPLKI